MKEDGFAGLQRMHLAQQVLCGQALEHDCRRLLEADRIRQLHQMPRRQYVMLAVGTQRTGGVGDALADLPLIDALSHRLDHASAFGAQARRQAWRRVEAAAEIGVDEIQADGVVAHAYFTGRGDGHLDLDLFENLGTTVLAELDALRHERAPGRT